jgi:hypothetical protein
MISKNGVGRMTNPSEITITPPSSSVMKGSTKSELNAPGLSVQWSDRSTTGKWK